MIKLADRFKCCGCTACASICGHKAITMQPDGMGFFYPEVDKDKCVECGLCEKVCAFNDHYDTSLDFPEPNLYAARHKDMHEIETSRSGAAFIAISDWVLKQNGVVYGAGFADHFRVVHKRATSKEECNDFKGSKYVQSDLTGIFKQVKEDLRKGLFVCFSGTPCQTAGLASYVGKRLRTNLLLVDIVCHGVPSPYIWRDYLAYMEKKYNQEAVNVNFRDKSRIGWQGHIESITFMDGKKVESKSYTYLFYEHIMLRPSCSQCHFTNFHRPSDFTIADYWGWKKMDENFNQDNKGCSLLFVNTEKGKKIFDKVKKCLNYLPTEESLCLQPNLLHPTVFNAHWMDFEKLYEKKGFMAVAKRFGDLGWRYEVQQFMPNIKSFIKNLIGKH